MLNSGSDIFAVFCLLLQVTLFADLTFIQNKMDKNKPLLYFLCISMCSNINLPFHSFQNPIKVMFVQFYLRVTLFPLRTSRIFTFFASITPSSLNMLLVILWCVVVDTPFFNINWASDPIFTLERAPRLCCRIEQKHEQDGISL